MKLLNRAPAAALTLALASLTTACTPPDLSAVQLTRDTVNLPAATATTGELTKLGPITYRLPEGARYEKVEDTANLRGHRITLPDDAGNAMVTVETKTPSADVARASINEFLAQAKKANDTSSLDLAQSVTWAPFTEAFATVGPLAPPGLGAVPVHVMVVAGHDPVRELTVMVAVQAPKETLPDSAGVTIAQSVTVTGS